ncbi:ABC transporter substrate-binding protein [Promicromonospora sp. NPDC057488]|uniref:ABC transporter substrate-binding protein n=1 Tax=Promicromonospora sp. NPDC057488 TaxID=3346147 RepID=UPI00366C7511
MKRARTRLTALAAAAVSTVLLAACGSTAAAGAGSAPSSAGEPTPGGELTVAVHDYCGAYDKQQTSGCTFTNIQVTDNLTAQDPETGEVLPWLATSWETEDDGRTYVLELLDGVTFSNGEAFDAAAVKANLDAIVELGEQGKSFQAAAYLDGYESTEVRDDLTVAVTFDSVKAGFLQALSEAPLGIVAPETTKKSADERGAEGVIGSGPFVLDELVAHEQIVLTKREDYAWASPVRKVDGPALLDKITFQVVPEQSVRVGALLGGQADAASTPSREDIAQVEATGGQIFARPSAGIVTHLLPNYADPVLSQEPVRQAIQHAINRDELHDVLYDDYNQVPTSILSSAFPNRKDHADALTYDPDLVKQILTDDGWALGEDGIWAKDGQRLSIDLQYSDSADKARNELIQQQLKANGIELELKELTAAEITANEASGDWSLSAGNLTRPDGDVLRSIFDPGYATRNKTEIAPDLTDLLERQSAELDGEERDAQIDEAAQIILDRGLAFPVTEFSSIVAASAQVHDIDFTAPYWAIFADTWIEH